MNVQKTKQLHRKKNVLTRSLSEGEDATRRSFLGRCGARQLYCYPRARAHSSLLACCRATEGLRPTLPKRLCNFTATALSQLGVSRGTLAKKNKTQLSASEEASLDSRVAHCLYSTGQSPLVSDSTVSMVDAILRHLCILQGTPVFVPGILMYPHFHLLELFKRWKLRVIGYDVDFVTMCGDEKDLRKKARAIGLSSNSARKHDATCRTHYSALVLLIGVDGRFLTNSKNLVQLVRNEFRALTVELRPVTGASLRPGGGGALTWADVHITCMDAAGELGGAVAFSANPLLAHGIRARLDECPPPIAKRKWMALMRHIAHLMVSDGLSFQFVLQAARWWSATTQNERTEERRIDAHADRIFKFFMASQAENMRGNFQNKKKKCSGSASNCAEVASNGNMRSPVFFKPHRGALLWMINAISRIQRRVEDDCVSLWEFLSRLDNDVEVVSAGEPVTPQRCVAGHSDSLLLRVRSPKIAAQMLRNAGFDAVPAVICLWDNSSSEDTRRQESTSTLREIVLLPDCVRCAALANHALFVPLYTEMKWSNRQKLQDAMRRTLSSSPFGSPSDEFRQHVKRTPFGHAYRSKEVRTLLTLWEHRCTNRKAFYSDSVPFLLCALLGPVPGCLLSRL